MHTQNNRRAWVLALVLAAGAWGVTAMALPARAFADTPKERPGSSPTSVDESGLVDLRPKWEKGAVTRYTMEVTSTNAIKDPNAPAPPASSPATKPAPKGKDKNAAEGGGTIQSKMTQTIGLKMRVVEVGGGGGKGGKGKNGDGPAGGGGGATVELVYESVKIALETPDMKMEYDSAAGGAGGKTKPAKKSDGLDDQDLLKPIFDKIVGTTMTLVFDENGEITEVRGGEQLNMLGSMSGMSNPGAFDPKSMGSLFGPIGGSKGGMGKRKVGEKWSNTDALNVGPLGEFIMKTQHTLRSHTGGRAEVQVDGKAEAKSEGDAATSPDKIKLKNSLYRGKYIWDTKKGQLQSMELEQSVQVGGAVEAKSDSVVKIRKNGQ
ncbi:MAG: hypothetical protein IBJ18_09755 [Phycisphaerales bacterium]|nr:hypothetical protein [Phycisphaerales bacterium]